MDKKKKSNDEKNEEDLPEIYRIVKLGNSKPTTRRDFIKNSLKAIGTAGLLSQAVGCGESKVDVFVDESTGECTCHTVCTCDSEADENNENQFEKRTTGSVCTCNLVCTCDSVCTCNSQGGGGGGGGGSHYWYPN